MAGNQWVFDLETNIFSNVVTIAKPKLQKKYKSMNFDTAFTTVEKTLIKTLFSRLFTSMRCRGLNVGQI